MTAHFSVYKLVISVLILVFIVFLSRVDSSDFLLNVDSIDLLFIVGGSIVLFPFAYFPGLLHPLHINGFLLFLSLFDVYYKHSQGIDIRFLPSLSSNETYFLRAYSIFILSLWSLFLLLGYEFFMVLKKNRLLNGTVILTRYLSSSGIMILFVIALYCSVMGVLIAMYKLGGFSQMVLAMERRSETLKGITYLRYFAMYGGFGVLSAIFFKSRLMLIISFAISFFSISMFGSRGAALLGVALPVVFSYNYSWNKIKMKYIVIALIFGVIFSVSMEYFKFGKRNDITFTPAKIFNTIGRDYGDVLPSTLYLIRHDEIDFLLGKNIGSAAYVLIPRFLWAEKPEGLGEDAMIGRKLYGSRFEYSGLPPGPAGIAYLNFSIVGVLIFAFIGGMINSCLFSKYIRAANNRQASFVWFLYPMIIVSLYESIYLYSMVQIIMMVIFLALCFTFLTRIKSINKLSLRKC